MSTRTWSISGLLFCSGFCALVYQTAWLREFRLIFGASTNATAAVLAIFMAGLGAGSAILGKRADAARKPLAYYGVLEIVIALSAAVSPFLLAAIRKLYVATGGSVLLGTGGATIARLVLSAIVLAIPTILMGGTLPAAARAAETPHDAGRRNVALLYGLNTLGAVTGTLLSTFAMLERFGTRQTLWLAAILNLAIGVIAVVAGGRLTVEHEEDVAETPAEATSHLPHRVVLAAAAIVGFAFLLMELVWYRMLAPILGGTTFTFGLILAAALLGIGAGGAAYSLRRDVSRPHAGTFAVTCMLEALAIMIPYALGDRLAIASNLLRSFGRAGFTGSVIGWSAIACIVVTPAGFVSGYQFPILIALLGGGRKKVAQHVGQTYAFNTGGAIAGSLAGGFGLIPLLSAPGCWQLAALLLVGTGIFTAAYAARARKLGAVAAAALIGVGTLACTSALGPTALWRHTGIGAGRSPQPGNVNAIRDWMHDSRRSVVWDIDGRESSIAVIDNDDLFFVVNGKTDGSARGDAGTQVMSGIVGALAHPAPKRIFVIGLGTGSTAGWLASLESVERVDVVELEPAILRVADLFRDVNRDVLHNPKVKISIGDAREVLLTTRERYDVIFSEPSNPYRAGIASLYTREFYESTKKLLTPGGVFVQWVQAYDIDAATVRTIYSTVRTAFPYIETWQTTSADLILVSSMQPIRHDADDMRRRLQGAYATAAHAAWRVESVEGVLAHVVANEKMPPLIATNVLNTDDRTVVEFGLARTLGENAHFNIAEIAQLAAATGSARPAVTGNVDWSLVDANRAMPNDPLRRRFNELYDAEDLIGALQVWQRQPWAPVNSDQVSRLAETMAEAGAETAAALAERLRVIEPAEADALLARLRLKQKRYRESALLLSRALVEYRRSVWPSLNVMGRALDTAVELARVDRTLGAQVFDAMSRPFVTSQWEQSRRRYLLRVAVATDGGCGPRTLAVLKAFEPDVPWTGEHLSLRNECYARAHLGDLAAEAERDLREFIRYEPTPLVDARGRTR